jgi:hypothetical protein
MKKHPSFLAVAIAFAIVVTGYAAALNVRAIGASLAPLIITTCHQNAPCAGGSNSGKGAGVYAFSADGRGLTANTKHNSTSATTAAFGVYGGDLSTSGTYNSGIFGSSARGTGVTGLSKSGTGVSGTSADSFGVNGTSTSNAGVSGTSSNSIGVQGTSTNYLGVYGTGPSYGVYGSSAGYAVVGSNGVIGLYGTGTSYGVYSSTSAGRGLFSNSGSGQAVYAQSNTGRAFEGHTNSGLGLFVTNGNGNGGDMAGSYAGVIARSDTFAIIATNTTGTKNLFWVDGSGNVNYTGSLIQHAAARRSGVQLYNPQSTEPAIEETGTAHLRFGQANVYFSSSLARSINARRGYQVFLTPDGDTRGLYVEGKYARGFVVREVGGGRGNLDFDYRVYAKGTEPEAATAVGDPNAPAVRAASAQIVPVPNRPQH